MQAGVTHKTEIQKAVNKNNFINKTEEWLY